MLLTAAQAADAKKGKHGLGPVITASASVTASTQGERITATATCPGKKRVAVGGGFATSPNSSEAFKFVAVYESLRTSRKAWTNSGVATAGASLTSYAYCRRLPKPPADITATASVPPWDSEVLGPRPGATASASCPGKRKLTSGGFSGSTGPAPNDFAIPYSNRTDGRSWIVSVANNSDLAETLTIHAYCAKGLKAAELDSGSNSEGSLGMGASLSTSSAGCAKGRLTAGGFNTNQLASDAPRPLITASQIVGSQWAVTALNLGDPGSVNLGSQGICL